MALDTSPAVAPPEARKPPRTAISSPHLHRLQRRHFLLFDVLPALATAVALALLFVHPIGGVEITLFLALWLATGLGLTVGFHRLFSHRAFATSPALAVTLLILGCMAARGPMLSWVAMHRRHHAHSDHEGDLHSPNLHGESLYGRVRGLLHAHLTWLVEHDYPNVAHYVPDLLADRALVRANQRYYWWVALGLVIPTLVGGVLTASWWGALTGFLWGGMVRMFVVEHSMSAVNSFLHMIGRRAFHTKGDNSRNSAWLGLLVWGEGWHNNHHAFPNSAAFGLAWYEWDPGYWFIRALEAVRLVWDVRVPSAERIAARRIA